MSSEKIFIHNKAKNNLTEQQIQKIRKGVYIGTHIDQILAEKNISQDILNCACKLNCAKINLEKLELQEPVLDIGGTGEYVIYKNSKCNLDIVDTDCDDDYIGGRATIYNANNINLPFEDEAYQYVTYFYTIMYMPYEIFCKSIQETYRVMKKGGILQIWDINTDTSIDGFIEVPIEVIGKKRTMEMTYSCNTVNEIRDMKFYEDALNNAGFRIMKHNLNSNTIYIYAQKNE